jgi:hypothetical protein
LTVQKTGAILPRLLLNPNRWRDVCSSFQEIMMRLEYGFQLEDCEVPRFAVEAGEGVGKLFTLGTLVLNVIATKARIEIIFHGLNPEDPERKIEAFKEIARSAPSGPGLEFSAGESGRVPGSSSYFQWLTVSKSA